MFDIGFTELIVISVVALLVIGPERLPETIRAVAMWLGRAKRTFTNFRQELESEIGVDDIKRDLRNEAIMERLEQVRNEFEEVVNAPPMGDAENKTIKAEKSSLTTEKPDE